jgi:bifunctional non-homologous end joining protein LigD
MIPIHGMNVVITGVIDGESRATATAKCQDAGANVQKAVTSTTELLITGDKVGASKIRKAAALGVRVVSWSDVWTGELPNKLDQVEELGEALMAPLLAPKRARQIAPQLAKGDDLPIGKGWMYEVKWDGVRGIATVADGQVSIQSRSGKTEYAEQYPEIAAELASFPDCVLDGELVVVDENGDGNFQSLSGGGEASYVVFDMLEEGAVDMRGYPLEARREGLSNFLAELETNRVGMSPGFLDGPQLLREVTRRGGEGVVAKRLSSKYVEGSRTSDWIKVKVRLEQEFVIVGWLPGEGELEGHVGSWLLAVVDKGAYRYCGKVGTGGTVEAWDAVRDGLQTAVERMVEIDLKQLSVAERESVTWVYPRTVIQVAFQRWTNDGHLWHPSFQGVRDDKDACDVVRERAAVLA